MSDHNRNWLRGQVLSSPCSVGTGYIRLTWLILGLGLLVRLLMSGQFLLVPDEAYYWTWSRHLDWAYFDQGPMLALTEEQFEILATNLAEILRWIQEAAWRLSYYGTP